MHEKALIRIQKKVQEGNYLFSIHARRELRNDNFTIEDVERGILSGKIVERQKDSYIGEWKYRIRGNSTKLHRKIEMIVKEEGNILIIIITVHLEK